MTDDPPRIGPGTVIYVVGPDTLYVVGSLGTDGPDAVLHLRTADGRDWAADRDTPEDRPR